MSKRAQITASQLRQGIGPLITLLLQGHEVALTHHGAPVGVIRGWTDADGPAPEVAPAAPVKPRKPAKPKKESGGKTWAAENGYRTSHLKPTFSTPPE
jgi:antitoxin (DNA-binding transcriptional repressor) of toxin-antitoxin stability system